jgi:hypothetical protein
LKCPEGPVSIHLLVLNSGRSDYSGNIKTTNNGRTI